MMALVSHLGFVWEPILKKNDLKKYDLMCKIIQNTCSCKVKKSSFMRGVHCPLVIKGCPISTKQLCEISMLEERNFLFVRGGTTMTRIPEKERDMMEQAIYLPMVLTVLKRDLIVMNKSPFKLKQPYLNMIEETIRLIQKELTEVKYYMHKNKLQVQQLRRDEAFTMFKFLYNGEEEDHNYFNPRIRNKVQELMEYYLFKRHYVAQARKPSRN